MRMMSGLEWQTHENVILMFISWVVNHYSDHIRICHHSQCIMLFCTRHKEPTKEDNKGDLHKSTLRSSLFLNSGDYITINLLKLTIMYRNV